MNRFAYRTTGLAIQVLENILKARISLHEADNIPEANNIFVINHFTRLETFVMPYYLNRLTRVPIWSLAAPSLFKGSLGTFLEKVGAVSTENPDRDRLVVKTLLTGEAMWIIFPEGRMVKTKQLVEKGRLMISYAGGKRPPHTGAATLAMRSEFYRRRLLALAESNPQAAAELLDMFSIESMQNVSRRETCIVPVNITYYPLRAKENLLSELSKRLLSDIPERIVEEIMTEGAMLISGVDMDVRFGKPIKVDRYLRRSAIRKDIISDRPIAFDDPIPSKRLMRRCALKMMQRYMHAIYDMTTVNYDHLFASLLRAMPFSRIKTRDLLAKAYLAVSRDLKKLRIFTHGSLRADSLHLLTDDHYEQFQDFMSVAVGHGAVHTQRDVITKATQLSTGLDFHGARIHNPVWVIANEVEPLKKFQRHIRRIAWQPSFYTRRKVAGGLLRSEIEQYKRDYREFFIQGESKDMRVGMPMLARRTSSQVGIVLLHGYMAAPLEVAQLAKYLNKRGFWVYAPRLRGHGTSPEDLALRTYKDWIRSAEIGYVIMRHLCRKVLVGGFSTGAGLALHLAAHIKEIKGVFAVSAPLRLQDLSARFVSAIDAWNRLMSRVGSQAAKKEFVENIPENPHINYLRNPIAGVKQLEDLMETLDPLLPTIEIPAIVIQSDKDPVVDPKGSKRIFDRLGSAEKAYTLFSFERHGILLGEGAEQVYQVVTNFARRFVSH